MSSFLPIKIYETMKNNHIDISIIIVLHNIKYIILNIRLALSETRGPLNSPRVGSHFGAE